MSLLAPNTGDEKMDKAYVNLKEHIERCKTFEEFSLHFKYIVKTDDTEVLNGWLLKVLYVVVRRETKHDFDRLLESVSDEKAKVMREWLEAGLRKQVK